MSQFFERQFSQEDLQRQLAQRRHHGGQSMGVGMAMPIQGQSQQDDAMNMSGLLGGGDSLDDIIMQNSKEFQRRQSMPRYGEQISGGDHDRRSGMMQFGSPNDGLNSFQFTSQESGGPHENVRRMSGDDMDMGTGFGDMTTGLGMGQSTMDFSSSMQGQNSLALDTSGSYHDMSGTMMGDMMPYSDVQMSSEATPMDMFGPDAFTNPFNNTSMTDFNMSMVNIDNSLSGRPNGSGAMTAENADEDMIAAANKISDLNSNMARNLSMNQNMANYTSTTSANVPQLPTSNEPYQSTPVPKIAEDATTERVQGPPEPPVRHDFKNVYSSSGFDMLGALMRVATRSNPEINIGAVDMSCAFVVCDITQADCPIIYVSDIFERLTGYNKHEVLGRNCRFLQAPDGKVMPGVKRKYVDDDSVYYLKTRIKSQQEAQRSLINYRKGGQPFMNLLTMIPIAWDTDEIKYIVGFQVDLVEQPSSVAGKGQGGSYTVNYSQGLLPQYIWTPPEITRPDTGQTISRDDVSTVLANFNNQSESELTKRMWDKVLLENTDDVVHVLSLKGLFLYLSPSSRHVLEYDASELVGTALSSVCHPSDIVPVTRELKDTSTGATVNVVFRIRRKNSGYTWFESHGSLCVEQGKGRKCIILVGRERPVYALGRHDIEVAGGIGENELWTKLSTSGMFLFVSSNVRILLDRHPDELVGTSIQALMRPKSKVEFGRCLERARTGKKVIYKHEIMNKRGQVLQAQTNLYPGDAAEGQKPTFLVGQTRLLRPPSRNMASAAHSNVGSGSHIGSESIVSTNDQASQGSGATVSLLATGDARADNQTRSVASTVGRDHVMTQAGGAGLAIGSQDAALASEDNIFDELKTTRCTSWQFELRQMEKSNRLLAEELASLLQNKKKRKRRKGAGHLQRDCANCHTRVTPEWRRGPSGNRDLCNSCGLRWAKQNGRVSPRTTSSRGDTGSKQSVSPVHMTTAQKEVRGSKSPGTKTSLPESNDKVTAVSEDKPRNIATTEKRKSLESQPVHAPSQGFQEGGPSGITNIDEEPGT